MTGIAQGQTVAAPKLFVGSVQMPPPGTASWAEQLEYLAAELPGPGVKLHGLLDPIDRERNRGGAGQEVVAHLVDVDTRQVVGCSPAGSWCSAIPPCHGVACNLLASARRLHFSRALILLPPILGAWLIYRQFTLSAWSAAAG
jgi:hypothetical protein